MWRILGSTSLIVAGIAAHIVDAAHHPMFVLAGICLDGGPCAMRNEGWSQTAYDGVRIGSWGLIVFGVVLTVAALVRYWVSQRREA